MTDVYPLIYGALAAVMQKLTSVAKRDKNTQQNFTFRGIDAVVNAVGPVLREHGVIVVPYVQSVDYHDFTTTKGAAMLSCRVVADYTFFASDGSSVTARVAGEAFDSGDKATPKAMSIAFRTALLQALALPTDDVEPDSQTYDRAPAERRPPMESSRRPASPAVEGGGGVTEAQLKALGASFGEAKITDRQARLDFVARVTGDVVESSKNLTKGQASKVIDALKKLPPDMEFQPDEELAGWPA